MAIPGSSAASTSRSRPPRSAPTGWPPRPAAAPARCRPAAACPSCAPGRPIPAPTTPTTSRSGPAACGGWASADSTGSLPTTAVGDYPAAMSKQPGDAPTTTSRTPLIEVTVLHEHGPSPSARRLIDAVEVVTANHVYVLDSSLRCVQMRKPGGAEMPADPRFVGARLVGGQVNTEESIEISYP